MGHEKILVAGAIIAVLVYLPQSFVVHAWQLLCLQALTGVSAGAIMPATGALLNMRTRDGTQGATFGLSNSVNAGGRMVAPLLGATLYPLIGMKGVFGIAALVYAALALVALYIWRKSVSSTHIRPIPRAAGD